MLDDLFHATPTGLNRRDFLKSAALLAVAAVGLPSELAARVVQDVEAGRKPTLIWLSFQECTGCSESLLRTTAPQLDELLLDLVNLAYHEALSAAAGHQAEAAKQAAMEEYAGEYILVVEGAIPTKDGGIYCQVGGKTAMEELRESAEHAAAIVCIGSCSSWGGIPSSPPNPTGAAGVNAILQGEGPPVVNIPGCPPNPYNFLGTVLQYATLGTLPELDAQGRPVWAYGRTIHEHCPRRPHFDAGRFAKQFGDEGHREGWCLYELGCKGPQTYANCSVQHFNEVPDAWPIGLGHPCFGCTEAGIGFNIPLHDTVEVPNPTPASTFAPITSPQGEVSPVATGIAGAVAGALLGGGLVASNKVRKAVLGDEMEQAVRKAESSSEEKGAE
jgi:hydrogenase small subunit